MSKEQPTIMAVHAHPDDETVFTGGTLALYAEKGVRTVLVMATSGEEGEIRDPDLNQEEARPRLNEIRRGELQKAVDILGISDLEYLGYRDSGMVGTEPNARGDNFHNANMEEATARLVALVRQYKPDVILTYDEFGAYGHPDHIMCNKVTHAAFECAGDPRYGPELGEPWQPSKFYYTHWASERWDRAREMVKERGLEWPWDREEEKKDDDPEHQSTEEGVVEQMQEAEEAKEEDKPPAYVPPPVTARLDVRPTMEKKRAATFVHRTQFAPDGFFLTMPEDIAAVAFGEEHYSLVRSHIEAAESETDLFEGLA